MAHLPEYPLSNTFMQCDGCQTAQRLTSLAQSVLGSIKSCTVFNYVARNQYCCSEYGYAKSNRLTFLDHCAEWRYVRQKKKDKSYKDSFRYWASLLSN